RSPFRLRGWRSFRGLAPATTIRGLQPRPSVMSNKSGTDLINEAKQRIREVSAADVKRALDSGEKPVLLDVREPNETNLGRIPGAVVIPRGTMEGKIEAAVPRDAELVVY